MEPGCTRTKQTFWTEDKFVVKASSGIHNREKRVVAEIVARELERAKPDKWDACSLGSFGQRRRRLIRPGHNWLLKFGNVAGSMSVEKEFKLKDRRKYEEYKGLCF